MDRFITVEISTQPLDVLRAISSVSDSGQGAIDTFIGVVRNHHNGRDVTGITYDAHDHLAKNILYKICKEAQSRWQYTRYFVAHFKGFLSVGEASVVIAVSSPHRAESFDACRYIIEEIKKRLPVWKMEHYVDGNSDWLPGHSLVGIEKS